MTDDVSCPSLTCTIEFTICVSLGPIFVIFLLLQIRAEKYARPQCRPTAKVTHRCLLVSSVMLIGEAPFYYFPTDDHASWIFYMLLLRYLASSVMITCLTLICYHILASFYHSLSEDLAPRVYYYFLSLCLFTFGIAIGSNLAAYLSHVLWPYVMPSFANSAVMILLIILLARYWIRANRLVQEHYPKMKTVFPAVASPTVLSPGSFNAHSAYQRLDRDEPHPIVKNTKGKPRTISEEIDPDYERLENGIPTLGEVRARLQLSRLRILFIAMAVALVPLIFLAIMRSIEILDQHTTDASLEKSTNSLGIVLMAVGLIAFGCWYGWIPMSWTGGPPKYDEMDEVGNSSHPAHLPTIREPFDLSYQSTEIDTGLAYTVSHSTTNGSNEGMDLIHVARSSPTGDVSVSQDGS